MPGFVKTDEAAQVTASLRLGGRALGFGFWSRDTPGTVVLRRAITLRAGDRAVLRRSAGRRVRILVGVNDQKGNARRFAATARLTR